MAALPIFACVWEGIRRSSGIWRDGVRVAVAPVLLFSTLAAALQYCAYILVILSLGNSMNSLFQSTADALNSAGGVAEQPSTMALLVPYVPWVSLIGVYVLFTVCLSLMVPRWFESLLEQKKLTFFSSFSLDRRFFRALMVFVRLWIVVLAICFAARFVAQEMRMDSVMFLLLVAVPVSLVVPFLLIFPFSVLLGQSSWISFFRLVWTNWVRIGVALLIVFIPIGLILWVVMLPLVGAAIYDLLGTFAMHPLGVLLAMWISVLALVLSQTFVGFFTCGVIAAMADRLVQEPEGSMP